jgi:CRISPR-associated endonuclease Csn1
MEKSYYIGLDLGTNSIGFAATNPQYEVLKFHQKAMWGFER